MKKQLSQPIRGARDLYPEDLSIRNWLFAKWREVGKSFGYEEIDGPILEQFDLFAVKSGEELVNKQMYTLTSRDGKKLGVRPEITPTYSRMVAKHQGQLVFPLRWMMFGNTWRYEKPQKGRVRDFWQWELNIVGGEETLADAEVLAIAAKALEIIGLTANDVVFRINNRQFMRESFKSLGIKNKYPEIFSIIDKKERISEEECLSRLKKVGLSTSQINKLNGFLKSPSIESSPKLKKLFSLLKNYGTSAYVKYDPLIVRNLDYYTGMVFECFDKKAEFRSVFGGGRFDDLVETFGGGKIPAVGFAMGDVVIIELLKRLNKLPKLKSVPTQVLVTIFSPEYLEKSIEVATILRFSNLVNTELYPDPNIKLDKQLKYADRKGIPYVVIIGPEEVEKNKVTIKNMTSGEQKSIPITDLNRWKTDKNG